MHTSRAYRDFSLRLYEEFLDEASFLYEQTLAYRDDPELGWLDAEDLDGRFEAHVDGLVVGGESALALCSRHAVEGEASALHAAMRVFCRLGRFDRVEAALAALDGADPARSLAVAEALAADCPPEWCGGLARIAAERAELTAAVAPALVRAGRQAEGMLVDLLGRTDSAHAAPVLEALGVVGTAGAASAVEAYVESEHPQVAAAAAVAALRLGSETVARWLPSAARARPELVLPAALCRGRPAVGVLCEALESGVASDAALIGLGLLGDLGATRLVFEQLGVPEHATSAALALQLLTGAELYADVFVPEPPDPEEWFDDERQRFDETGEAPTRPDGEPWGATETRLVADPAVWKEWIAAHRGRFDPQQRYRYGEPLSPRSLLNALAAERLPNRIRALVCDELRIRYACSFPLRVAMPVAEQRRLLDRLAEWVSLKGGAFTSGVWHFAGKPLPVD
jgi:hypothetical protein